MRPDFAIPLEYPNGPGTTPSCQSFEVCYALGVGDIAASFMQGTDRDRRADTLKGRRWDLGDGNLPLYLYKYRHLETDNPDEQAKAALLERARDFLVRGKIWVAAAETLNDLHDMRFNVVQTNDPQVIEDWLNANAHLLRHMAPAKRIALTGVLRRRKMGPAEMAELQTALEKTMGVFCASQDPRNEPMWAHYAADHRGYCVQIDTTQDELFLLAEKAIYTATFPTITLPNANRHDQTAAYLSKSTAWSYEREWRVVVPQSNFAVRLRPNAIAGVILGARASTATREAIQAFNAERVQAGYRPFRVYQSRQHRDRFGMLISKAML